MKFKLLFAFLLLPLFSFAQTYSLSTLVNFPAIAKKSAANPTGYLTTDSHGNLYGVAGGGVAGTLFKVTPKGIFTVVHNFTGPDGSDPQSAVVFDKAGNMYGVTMEGGKFNYGTVFKMTPKGALTVLHSFTDTAADGNYPTFAVTLDSNANVYGFVYYTVQDQPNGGVIYRVTPQGSFSVVYNFGQDAGYLGFNPQASMITDREGNFYGVTLDGGDFDACGLPGGVVFKMTPNFDYSVLHTFCQSTGDLGFPHGKLTQDNAGNMFGGANGIFKITQSGVESVLTTCCATFNIFTPTLVRDSAGNLYGTVPSASTSTNPYVFKVAPDGTNTTLYTFKAPINIGDGVVLDSAGNLYGTTINGGTNGTGSVFKLTKK